MRFKQITHRMAEHRQLARQERDFARALDGATTPSARQELLLLRRKG